MFNFHKPRVYRSADGCCICRAKSSSSRFTASRKYEKESMQCFNLNEPRNGEICNACVLLVKRYKRLPIGSKRHWGHVSIKAYVKKKKNSSLSFCAHYRWWMPVLDPAPSPWPNRRSATTQTRRAGPPMAVATHSCPRSSPRSSRRTARARRERRLKQQQQDHHHYHYRPVL